MCRFSCAVDKMLRYDENTSKGEKCSITLEELKELIKKHNDSN